MRDYETTQWKRAGLGTLLSELPGAQSQRAILWVCKSHSVADPPVMFL